MDELKATKKALIILLHYYYYSEKALSPYVAAIRERTIDNNNSKHYIGTGTSST
jgi:hypothetical protein